MLRNIAFAFALSLLAGCARHDQTDQDLRGEAEHAVNTRLDTEASFTFMKSVAAQKISCGHASAPDMPGRGKFAQDFVYLHGRLIMEDEPDFDQAWMECDVAASGGKSSDLGNATDS